MNLSVLLPILVILIVLRVFKAGLFLWIVAWTAAMYLSLVYGFTIPIPTTVVVMYMGIALLALATYVVSSRECWADFSRPILLLIVEPRYQLYLVLVALAIPALVAAQIYVAMTQPIQAPSFARTVHPAPPSEPITVHDEEFDLNASANPFRELEETETEQFAEHVENGRRVYYENCFLCHGDDLLGDGLFAYGLNPIPTNFRDSGTIAMFEEGFLFWRIAKGGPGMPDEGGPWESAMPAWEKFLTVEEMWDVVLFLYDHTGQRPREQEEHGE
jgi:hypothetical protein